MLSKLPCTAILASGPSTANSPALEKVPAVIAPLPLTEMDPSPPDANAPFTVSEPPAPISMPPLRIPTSPTVGTPLVIVAIPPLRSDATSPSPGMRFSTGSVPFTFQLPASFQSAEPSTFHRTLGLRSCPIAASVANATRTAEISVKTVLLPHHCSAHRGSFGAWRGSVQVRGLRKLGTMDRRPLTPAIRT